MKHTSVKTKRLWMIQQVNARPKRVVYRAGSDVRNQQEQLIAEIMALRVTACYLCMMPIPLTKYSLDELEKHKQNLLKKIANKGGRHELHTSK